MNLLKDKKRFSDHLIAFFTIAVWSVTFISTKQISGIISPSEIVLARYIIAYLALWIIHPRFMKFSSLKEEGLYLLAAISGASVYQLLENLSVYYTNPSSTSFITATAPIFTAIFAKIVLRERFPSGIFAGMFISLAGVFLISFGDSKITDTGVKGDIIMLCGIWLWAVYSVIVKKISEYGRNGFAVTRRIFFYAVITEIPIAFLTGGVHPAEFAKPVVIFNLLFLGILASSVCFATWNRCVANLGAVVTSKYLFVMPALTLVAQTLYNRTRLSVIAYPGMALILLGLFLSQLDIREILTNKKRRGNNESNR